ncbi:hypothetical protein TrST_g4982 [Triparma strigata]|uniref:Pep3/Vps18 beta-propeller domain-containing protein n=1 Tax=Triparma strigata TaxID=1606541 RepID=A0A9W7AC84_9STRA|nr:hypothetical protein TrST_g4982 [Triparma strigata]
MSFNVERVTFPPPPSSSSRTSKGSKSSTGTSITSSIFNRLAGSGAGSVAGSAQGSPNNNKTQEDQEEVWESLVAGGDGTLILSTLNPNGNSRTLLRWRITSPTPHVRVLPPAVTKTPPRLFLDPTGYHNVVVTDKNTYYLNGKCYENKEPIREMKKWEKVMEKDRCVITKLPGSVTTTSLKVLGTSVCLLSEFGLYHGTLSDSPSDPLQSAGIIMYDDIGVQGVPKGLGLTSYHFVILCGDGNVVVVSRVSLEVVQRVRVNELAVLGREKINSELVCDARRVGAVWLRRGRDIFHVSSPFEERDVWKLRLRKILRGGMSVAGETSQEKADEAEFDEVQALCSTSEERALVNLCRAEFHLEKGRGELAARWLARAPRSLAGFASTSLRLCLPSLLAPVDVTSSTGPSTSSLTAYLTESFNKLSKEKGRGIQLAMLGAWIAELMLSERGSLQQHNNKHMDAAIGAFLARNARQLDSKTTLSIMKSHGAAAHEIAAFAAACGDFGSAVRAALSIKSGNANEAATQRRGAMAALKMLDGAEISTVKDVYYFHAEEILSRAPVEASEAWIRRYSDGLDPELLLPAILFVGKRAAEAREEQDDETDTIEDLQEVGILSYLEGVVKLGNNSAAVHNHLMTLYADLEDEAPLFRYLTNVTTGIGGDTPPLSLKFALHVILKTQRHHRSAVKVYMAMGKREAAVELALNVDPTLARELAENSIGPEQKKLWLMIAKDAAKGGGEDGVGKDAVAKVIGVLKESGVLSIEDVLPFLPDFVQIDTFKEEIVAALSVYSEKIQRYKDEVNECDMTCDSLREEIEEVQNAPIQCPKNAKCALSGKPLLRDGVSLCDVGENFYVFPSGFVVHDKALRAEVWRSLTEAQRERVAEIESELEQLGGDTYTEEIVVATASTFGAAKQKKAVVIDKSAAEREKELEKIRKLQDEFDSLIASECPLTGKLMVDSINQPLEGWDDDL